MYWCLSRSVLVAKHLVLTTLDQEVASSNLVGGGIQFVTVQHFIITLPSSRYDLNIFMLKGMFNTKSSSSLMCKQQKSCEYLFLSYCMWTPLVSAHGWNHDKIGRHMQAVHDLNSIRACWVLWDRCYIYIRFLPSMWCIYVSFSQDYSLLDET